MKKMHPRTGNLGKEIRENKKMFIIYLVLRVTVLAVLVAQFVKGNYNGVFLCLLTLVLFMIPSFLEKRIKIDVPDTLEIIVLLFIFAAEILGEIQSYYELFPYWDIMLHTLNGFIMAALGLSLVDILNRSKRFAITLSPFFVVMVAFCFSMTIGVLWEFFEYGMDMVFHTDMQKDTVITAITSGMLDPSGGHAVTTVPIESVVVNGQEWNFGGYLDIGLIDTMEDLMVNFVGAVVFSLIGYFYIKGKYKTRFAEHFILTPIEEPEKPAVPEKKEK